MQVFAISDLHLGSYIEKTMDMFGEHWQNHWANIRKDWSSRVSQDDVVLIAGDICWSINIEDAMHDILSIAELPGRKVILRGNHDFWWNSISQLRSKLPNNFFAIQNDAICIDDVVICGTRGWSMPQTQDDKKIYQREVLRLELSLKYADKFDKVFHRIAMMHFPPYNEKMDDSEFTGLLEAYGVRQVVFGHLHKGAAVVEGLKNDIEYSITSCDIIGFKLKNIYSQ